MNNEAISADSHRSLLITSLIGVIAVLVVGAAAQFGRPSVPARTSDVTAVTDGWADEASCIDCHSQAEEFAPTGHARTLRPASDPESIRLLALLTSLERATDEGTRIVSEHDRPIAVNEYSGVRREIELDWCFGSGTHACTWVATLPDSHGNTDSLEFRFSWFASQQGFDLTPGQPQRPGNSAVSALGLLFDGPKARRCFSCHATAVPIQNGRIDEVHLRPGVTCQRCHGPRAKHVQSEGEYHPEDWGIADRMESVRRCAVCHRLAEEHEPEKIVPGNVDVVRFQPVGLLQSKCFVNSDMSCTTCHDPHVPMQRPASLGIWQCVQCHDPSIESHTLCGAGESDDCMSCHMPAVDMTFPVAFTDHWIRIPDRPDQTGENQ